MRPKRRLINSLQENNRAAGQRVSTSACQHFSWSAFQLVGISAGQHFSGSALRHFSLLMQSRTFSKGAELLADRLTSS